MKTDAGKKANERRSECRRVLVAWLKRWIQIPIGMVIYLRLMWRKAETHYVIAVTGLGDDLRLLSYLDSYKKIHGYAHCTVVCAPTSQTKQMMVFYADVVDALYYLGKRKLYYLYVFGSSWFGQSLSANVYRDRITFAAFTATLSWRGAKYNPYFDLDQFMHNVLLQLPPEVRGEKPKIPDVDIEPYVREYDLKKGGTVFLNDVANTVRLDVTSFLGKAADRLKKEGFTVVTLTASKDQPPVPGTQGLPCVLATAYRLAEYGGTVLGVRSGFMDFMAMTGCRTIAINDPCYVGKGFFDLASCWGDMNQKCSSLDYLDDEKTLSEVMEILRNDMAGG